MSAPLVASRFLELLEESGLFSSAQIVQVVEQHKIDELPSAKAAALTLISHGLITRFQAERLLRGFSRGFLYDRYKVLELLGSGAMSWVYLAEEVETHRRVALKVLTERFENDAGMLTRLKLEACAGRKLNHPNLMRTELLGWAAGVPYVIMELFEGIGLHELIEKKRRILWPQACDIIRQAANGLHHAHQTGFVHRDVKPSNVLISAGSLVKVLDFGLSLVGKEAEDDEFSLVMLFGHDCLGTANYMPPEQSHDSNAVDRRADLYSLGCTFYHALSGRVPFSISSNAGSRPVSDVLEAHRNRPPRPLRELVSGIPEPVLGIVEKMMAKQPKQRFATAADVERALAPFTGREPLDFDFRAILAAREKEGRRRLAASQSARKRSGTQSSSSRTARRSTATLETAIERDTQPESAGLEPTPGATGRRADEGRNELVLGESSGTFGSATSCLADDSTPLPKGDAFLVSLEGGTAVPLKAERIVIGRDAECDLVLPDRQVSGRHCELRLRRGCWRIVDLGSTNGIEVNGIGVTNCVLRPGDRLTLGRGLRFRIHYDAPTSKSWWRRVFGDS